MDDEQTFELPCHCHGVARLLLGASRCGALTNGPLTRGGGTERRSAHFVVTTSLPPADGLAAQVLHLAADAATWQRDGA